ncbi:MAG: SPOR domain-containing protein [Desulfobacteraceae bacterium]|nr:SPOR domain-containing protein [Desulfobacteraceae bacterium]
MTEEQDKFPLKLTRKAMIVWSGLIFFSMGWMFVVGILVGRGTIPMPSRPLSIDSEINTLKQKEQSDLDAQSKHDKESGNNSPFWEELKKPSPKTVYKVAPQVVEKPSASSAKEPVESPAAIEKLAELPAPKANEEPAEKPVEKTTVAIAPDKEEKAAKPAAPKPTPAAKAESAAAASEKRFTIQVASFQDLESAERSVKNLKDKGFSAHHVRVEIQGKGAWYRVRVGSYDSKIAAEAMLKKLEQSKIKGMVTGI